MIKKIKIGKETWKIRTVAPDPLGENYGGTKANEKEIVIFRHPDHTDKFMLFGTLAHEILHARNKRLSEKAVCETEAALIELAKHIFSGE